MQKDLNNILDYIDTLNELDTKDVPPLAEVASQFASEQKEGSEKYMFAMRADAVQPGVTHEVAMQNAPDTDGTFFKVPKVIEK